MKNWKLNRWFGPILVGAAVLATAVLAPVVAAGQEAGEASVADLCRQGEKYIKQKKLPEALTIYRKAVEKDANSAASQYGLARTYALLRTAKKTCDYEAYRSTILEHLQNAVKLDPSLFDTIKKDRDLNCIRDTIGFQILNGLDPLNGSDVSLILQRVTWYGPCPGAYGPQSGLVFDPKVKGKVTFWTLDTSGAKVKKIEHPGTYALKEGQVILKLKKPVGGKTEFKGTLSSDGTLDFEDLPGPFGDELCDCEA